MQNVISQRQLDSNTPVLAAAGMLDFSLTTCKCENSIWWKCCGHSLACVDDKGCAAILSHLTIAAMMKACTGDAYGLFGAIAC